MKIFLRYKDSYISYCDSEDETEYALAEYQQFQRSQGTV